MIGPYGLSVWGKTKSYHFRTDTIEELVGKTREDLDWEPQQIVVSYSHGAVCLESFLIENIADVKEYAERLKHTHLPSFFYEDMKTKSGPAHYDLVRNFGIKHYVWYKYFKLMRA